MIGVEWRGRVAVVRMDAGENRFDRESVDALHASLDEVEAVEGPMALVTTGAGRFYSNGLDLDWLAGAGDGATGFIDDVHRLLGRVLGFPAITVAAVNGHAFADAAVPEADVVDRAVALATGLADKNREVIAAHKRLLFGDALAACGLRRA